MRPLNRSTSWLINGAKSRDSGQPRFKANRNYWKALFALEYLRENYGSGFKAADGELQIFAAHEFCQINDLARVMREMFV
jgi:hypothetical protein